MVLGRLEDKDVMRLQKLKDNVFPVYDYERLVEMNNRLTIGHGLMDFYPESAYYDVKARNRRAAVSSKL